MTETAALATVDIEAAADPALYVLQACERAKAWLADALEHGEIDQIVELKSQAEAIRVYTAQKQLGKDAELSAAEIVRRAERGIGLAIRKGQEAGEIRNRGERGPISADYVRVRGGREESVQAEQRQPTTCLKPSPTDFVTPAELFGARRDGIYAMTDDVTDDQFESALSEGKAEGNLARANVVRKVRAAKESAAVSDRPSLIASLAGKGYSSRQISAQIGVRDDTVREVAQRNGIEIPADAVMARTKKFDSNRIVRETVHTLEGLAMGLDLVVPSDLDRAEIADWSKSLTDSIRAVNRLIKQMKELDQ